MKPGEVWKYVSTATPNKLYYAVHSEANSEEWPFRLDPDEQFAVVETTLVNTNPWAKVISADGKKIGWIFARLYGLDYFFKKSTISPKSIQKIS